MRRSIPLLSAALAAAPLAISQPDSSVTELRLSGGRGAYAYVTRGCDNSVISKEKIDFDNVGVEASHKFTWPVRVGARAGVVRPQASGLEYYYDASQLELRYVNPYLSLEWPGFSIGGGYVSANRHFPEEEFSTTASGHIRIGKKTYFEMSFFEGVPLLTAGYAQMGLGFRLPKADLWIGMADVPQDKPGLVTRGEYRIGDRLGIGGTARLGSSEGVSESGFALSLSYRFTHRTTRTVAASPPEPSAWHGVAPAPRPSGALPDSTPPPPDPATAPAASDSVRSPRRGRSRAPRGRRSRRAPC